MNQIEYRLGKQLTLDLFGQDNEIYQQFDEKEIYISSHQSQIDEQVEIQVMLQKYAHQRGNQQLASDTNVFQKSIQQSNIYNNIKASSQFIYIRSQAPSDQKSKDRPSGFVQRNRDRMNSTYEKIDKQYSLWRKPNHQDSVKLQEPFPIKKDSTNSSRFFPNSTNGLETTQVSIENNNYVELSRRVEESFSIEKHQYLRQLRVIKHRKYMGCTIVRQETDIQNDYKITESTMQKNNLIFINSIPKQVVDHSLKYGRRRSQSQNYMKTADISLS